MVPGEGGLKSLQHFSRKRAWGHTRIVGKSSGVTREKSGNQVMPVFDDVVAKRPEFQLPSTETMIDAMAELVCEAEKTIGG